MADVASVVSKLSVSQSRGQLPLEIRPRDEATLDNFLARPALEPLIATLRAQQGVEAVVESEALVYVCGPEGTGKSHLLQACCNAPGLRTQYLPLSELHGFSPSEVLQGLEGLELVCLDDLQVIAGDSRWETALFNFYNEVRGTGCRLLVSASGPPRTLALSLEDLRSRLSSGVVYQLQDATDEEKAAILVFRAGRRGMSLPQSVAAYIVSRAPRALHDLLEILDELDEASLVQQRALSIPFAREVLRL